MRSKQYKGVNFTVYFVLKRFSLCWRYYLCLSIGVIKIFSSCIRLCQDPIYLKTPRTWNKGLNSTEMILLTRLNKEHQRDVYFRVTPNWWSALYTTGLNEYRSLSTEIEQDGSRGHKLTKTLDPYQTVR